MDKFTTIHAEKHADEKASNIKALESLINSLFDNKKPWSVKVREWRSNFSSYDDVRQDDSREAK